MRARLAVGSVLVVLVVMVGAPPSVGVSSGGDRGPAGPSVVGDPVREEAFDALAAEAGPRGTVRAFVELAVPTVPEGDLAERQVERQRDAIEAATDAVLKGLGEDGVEVRRTYGSIPFLSLEVTRAALERLEGLPEVAMVTEVGTAELFGDPPPVVGAPGPILAPEAWALGADGHGQLVAVIDTGMNSSSTIHPDLAAKVVHEACFNVDELCPNEEDVDLGVGAALECSLLYPCYHGTSVAGVVAATAPAAGLFPISLVGSETVAPSIDWDDLAAALEHVATTETDLPVAAVNLSLGVDYNTYTGPDCDGQTEMPAVEIAVQNLVSQGIAVVAASGNGGLSTRIAEPACLSDVVAVAATDEDHQVHTDYSNSSTKVALWAPGGFDWYEVEDPEPTDPEDECSVVWGVTLPLPWEEHPFCRLAGTSFAAPHVAGAYAIVRQALSWTVAPEEDHLELATDALVDNGEPYTDPRNSVTRPKLLVEPAVEELLSEWPLRPPGTYRPSSVERIVDTALGVGTCDEVACATIPGNGVPVAVQVAGEGGVPSEVGAVMVRVSAQAPSGAGFLGINSPGLMAFEGLLTYDDSRPSVTTLVASLDEDGAMEVVAAFAAVDLQVDVLGWFEAGGGRVGLTPVEPTVLADTDLGAGSCDPSPCARLVAEDPVTVEVAGMGDVPLSGVEAVVVSVLAHDAADEGVLTVATDDLSEPHAVLVADDDRDAAQTVILPVAEDGTVTVVSDVAVDVVLDVVGWFGEQEGGLHEVHVPELVLQTDDDEVGECVPFPCGPLDDTGDVMVKVADIGGIPDGVGAVVLHVSAASLVAPALLEVNPGTNGSAARLSLGADVQSVTVVAVPDEDGYVTFRTTGGPVDGVVVVTGTFSPPA